METIFKEGMKVYDKVFFGETPLKITEVKEDETLRVLCEEVIYCYTGDGRFIGEYTNSNRNRVLSQTPTLSTSPYTFEGFEQKAPAPTYEEAEEKLKCYKDKYPYYCLVSRNVVYPKSINPDVFEALRKLIILRDYYNEGWQPDWEDDESKFTIGVYENEITTGDTYCFSCVLSFKSDKVRDKFMKEQKELLEIAKPLL